MIADGPHVAGRVAPHRGNRTADARRRERVAIPMEQPTTSPRPSVGRARRAQENEIACRKRVLPAPPAWITRRHAALSARRRTADLAIGAAARDRTAASVGHHAARRSRRAGRRRNARGHRPRAMPGARGERGEGERDDEASGRHHPEHSAARRRQRSTPGRERARVERSSALDVMPLGLTSVCIRPEPDAPLRNVRRRLH